MTLVAFRPQRQKPLVAPATEYRRTPADIARERMALPPLAAWLVALGAAGIATAWSAATHSMVLYGDARAHLDVARHVTDGLNVGLAQLGSVWLPLPHILLVPLVAITPLWHNGAAGAIVGGACFVYGSLRLFSLVEEVSGSRLAAWCGFAVFVLNLNVLYLQSTALTEPVLLAFFIGAVYHLARWMRTLGARDLLWGAVFIFCATLTRYEGWALLAAAVLVVGVWASLNDRRQKSPQANLVLFVAVACYGIVLWLLYNLIIFHDPLYFLHSAYSAQAINEAQAQFAGTKGDAWRSLLTYGWDMIGILGAPVLIAGAVSSILLVAIRHPDRRRTTFTLVLLAAPVLFEFVSLYTGQTTIRVPQLFPHGMWNDRYGIMALPLCAVAIGLLIGRWRWTLALAVPATAAAFLIMALGTPLTLADGRTGTSSAAGGRPETAAAYLSRHYRGGEILADDSAASSLMFASNLDLRQFVSPGFHPFWEKAITSPAREVAWVVSYPGDAVTSDMTAHPDRFRDFRIKFTEGKIRIFGRSPSRTMALAAKETDASSQDGGTASTSGQAGRATPGYWLSASDGEVFSFDAPFWGSPASDPSNCLPAPSDREDPFGACSVMAARPDGQGYWILDSTQSRIFAYGKAVNLGQPWDYYQSLPAYLVPTGAGIASTPSGNGYWVAESSGRVFAYGDAHQYGDASGQHIGALIVGMAATSDGHGYWLVAADGSVFAYGDAHYYGSMSGHHLNRAIVGMAADPATGGYWLVAADGGIFSFHAPFGGSLAGAQLRQPVVGMAANPDGPGYWTVAANGGIGSFGGAPLLGSMGGKHLNSTILGITAAR